MRYGIFADIHGNLEAFSAVLGALANEKIDEYLCIGDIIGYGANPCECLERLKTLSFQSVSGNHEYAALGLLSLDYLNDYARTAVLWTKNILKDKDMDFLKSPNLVFKNDDLVMVHGSLDNPDYFSYLFSPYESKETFKLLDKTVCFIAHTHNPKIFVKRDVIISLVYGNTVKISPEYKYVVNIGSVGQPRDGDNKASYCVYDTKDMSVEIKRVPYDIKSAQKKILDAGLPKFLADRLGTGK
ncbi:MAG TPA: metallophosphoesterase [Candidatus Omnitrophica bacterium]|nr:metallophosphoesterase [Candidatus Omnitrophota bacterium]